MLTLFFKLIIHLLVFLKWPQSKKYILLSKLAGQESTWQCNKKIWTKYMSLTNILLNSHFFIVNLKFHTVHHSIFFLNSLIIKRPSVIILYNFVLVYEVMQLLYHLVILDIIANWKMDIFQIKIQTETFWRNIIKI